MRSPFPGMDPYLENPATWSGVHHAIVGAIVERLGPAVRPRYAVRIEDRSLLVIRLRDRRLTTAVELLSPLSKTSGLFGREGPLRRRADVLASGASWMEIDLLREGLRAPRPEGVPDTEYRVYVSRGWTPQLAEVWPIRLQEKLPTVPVSLQDDDPDVPLDLQAAVTAAIERGSYDLGADYSADPVPPLTGVAAEWARALLRSRSA